MAVVAEAIRLGLKASLAGEALGRYLGGDGTFVDETDFESSPQGDGARLRDHLVRSAQLSLQANRPRDAVEALNHVSALGNHLSSSERALFVYCTLLVTTEVKLSLSKLPEESGGPYDHTLALYRSRVKFSLKSICLAQVGVLEKYLMPTSSGESTVSYLRLKGHLLELVSRVDPDPMFLLRTLSAYVAATEKAELLLCPSHSESIQSYWELAMFLEHGMLDTPRAYAVARTSHDLANVALSQIAPMRADMKVSKRIFKSLGDLVRRLSKTLYGKEDLVPFKLCSKEEASKASCSETEYREFNSTSHDIHMLKLRLTRSEDDIDAYRVEDDDDEADTLLSKFASLFRTG